MRDLRIAVLWILAAALSAGQEASIDTPPQDRNLSALTGVADPLAAAMDEVDRLLEEMEATPSAARKAELATRIEAERERVRQLRGNFREIVGGSESAGYVETEEVERTLQDQFSDLLDPLVGALREPTAKLREMEETRKDLAVWEDRFRKAERVIERIDDLLGRSEDARVQSELRSTRRLWEGRRSDAVGQVEVLRLQIDEREATTPSFWESISGGFRDFWRTRGLNLLLAVVIGVAAYLLVKKAYALLRRTNPVLRNDKHLVSRASAILSLAAAVIAAVVAVMMVFYVRGDWLLLTLMIVLLIATAWAGKTALPPYIEQIRMLLNIGSVREGERILYRELPWEVTKLGFYTIFTNPALDGGRLRVPLKDVMGMISRQPDAKEPWFPTQDDDWAVLADGTYGKVIRQTPEQVVMLKLGGSLKTYPTAEFLEQMPENLSHGFRVTSVFGIDYAYQEKATGAVVEIFISALTTAMVGEFGREAVRSVKVEFSAANSSSLDYTVLADFSGDLGHRFKFIERMIQRVCVDVCNEQGWVIPFTQITVNRAAEG